MSDWFPYAVVTSQHSEYVYVANNGSDNISAYKINQESGALTPQNTKAFDADLGPYALAIGKFE